MSTGLFGYLPPTFHQVTLASCRFPVTIMCWLYALTLYTLVRVVAGFMTRRTYTQHFMVYSKPQLFKDGQHYSPDKMLSTRQVLKKHTTICTIYYLLSMLFLLWTTRAWVERGTMRENCLAHKHNTIPDMLRSTLTQLPACMAVNSGLRYANPMLISMPEVYQYAIGF